MVGSTPNDLEVSFQLSGDVLVKADANWQLTRVAKNGCRAWAASWLASSGQIQDTLMGSAVCMERGRERKCSVLPSRRGFLFPRRLKLPCQNMNWDLSLLSSKFLWDSRFLFPDSGPTEAALDTDAAVLSQFSLWLALNPFCLCLELRAFHADVRRSGHPAVQGLWEWRGCQQAAWQNVSGYAAVQPCRNSGSQ